MYRDFDITVRHESGTQMISVTLLPDSPNKKPIAASCDLKDNERALALEANKCESISELIGLTVDILIDDVLEMDQEGRANIV